MEQFDTVTQNAMQDNLFRGSVLRVERFGKLQFEKAWGDALYDGQDRIPMKTNYLFDLASLSKLFTTNAILRLITLKKLQEHTLILDLLPYKDPRLLNALNKIDISSLLDHSSGIHYWYPFYTRQGESFESILSSVVEKHPLEKRVIYSDLNFMLLGLIVEQVTGKLLAEAMTDLVFSPLGMKSATYHPDPCRTVATEFGNRIEKQMVTNLGLEFAFWRTETVPFRGTTDDGNCHYFFKDEAGHAGIYANAKEVASLGKVYSGQETEYLDPELKKIATTNRGNDRGYGFQFGELYPQEGFGHTGFTGTYLHINPATGLTITLLTNRLHVACPQNINPFRQEISKLCLQTFA